MKTLLSKLLCASILIILSKSFACGQWGPGQPQIDHTTFNLSRTIRLSQESEKLEILLPVSGPIVAFSIKISSEIFEGELTIEIYDPNGEKQGNYSIDNQISLKPNKIDKSDKPRTKEIVSGKISKSVEYPINGKWKVLIIPKNAIGEIVIESDQLSTKQILDKANKR
jgi:hypothetical protein